MSETAEIRKFLMKSFSDEELKILCADHFRTVYEDITDGMTKTRIIHELIEHCVRSNQLDDLVKKIQEERPDQFAVTVQASGIEDPIERKSPPRSQWSAEYDARLDAVIQNSPLTPDKDHAYLYLIVDPINTDDELLKDTRGNMTVHAMLNSILPTTLSLPSFPPGMYSPEFSDRAQWYREVDGWIGYFYDNPRYTADRDPGHSLDLFVRPDGSGHLFCGRAAERLESNFLLFEKLIAGITTCCLRFFGEIYKRANYAEDVITGIAITGLKGAISCFLRQRIIFYPHPFLQQEYRRLERSSATTLADAPDIVARKLVMPLIDTITQERYDPFKN